MVSDAGFTGVEFAFRLSDADQDAVRDVLNETGTEVAGAHVPIEWLETDFDETMDRYQRLGCETVVIPSIDDSYFESKSTVANAADRLMQLAKRIDDRGMQFCYHNHAHEFVRLEDQWAFDELVAATDESVSFQLDLPAALYAGADPVALLHRVGDRTQTVHFYDRDIDTKASVSFGDGDVDLSGCIAAAREVDVEWVLYEGDYEKDTLQGAASTISELIAD
ncbi:MULTISPECIES: sugar phosphate isomerase/epimerase [unclassified Haladaptatus]|uniref:sugar phosphate isomerase/epimerase family protein n=1 Tax=unclassified Haladaptatus TaxID=2622732 RepID=UPI00209C29F7|nr:MULTISPECIES: sugar phosphate isomerase/epimerase [unclassified Haladaptatus]